MTRLDFFRNASIEELCDYIASLEREDLWCSPVCSAANDDCSCDHIHDCILKYLLSEV